MINQQRILVTGSRGYIGRRVCDLLRDRGVSFTGLALPRYDITRPETYRSVFEHCRPTAVIHLAAVASVGECRRDPAHAAHVNLYGTQQVYEVCREYDVRRIVFASSCATYGEGRTPVSWYGHTKLLGEDLTYRSGVPDTLVARIFNVAGEHDSNPRLLPELIRSARQGKPFRLTSPYETVRDYVHVRDVAAALVWMADDQADRPCSSGLEEIGTGVGTSIAELIDRVERLAGRRLEVTVDVQLGNPSRAVASLDDGPWRPKRTLDEIVESAWKEQLP